MATTRTTNRLTWEGSAIGLAIGGILLVTLAGGAISWDGSLYFISVVGVGQPFVPHHRWANALVQTPTLLALHLTHNLGLLRIIFGLSYALLPIGALILSVVLIKRSRIHQHLLLWPILGLGLGTLPVQFELIQEATQTIELFWVIVLGIACGLPTSILPIVLFITGIIFFIHPIAGALYVVAAGACCVLAAGDATLRRRFMKAALFFAVLAAIRLAIPLDSYERSQATLPLLLGTLRAIIGWGSMGLACLWSAAGAFLVLTIITRTGTARQRDMLVWATCGCLVGLAIVFVIGQLSIDARASHRWLLGNALPLLLSSLVIGQAARDSDGERGARHLMTLAPLCLMVAGLGFFLWVRDAHQWSGVPSINRIYLFTSLPFMVGALAESYLLRGGDEGTAPGHFRLRILPLMAVLTCLVLGTQALTYAHLAQRIERTVATSSSPCLSATTVRHDVAGTAFDHWSLSPYLLAQEDQRPAKIVLPGNGCAIFRRTGVAIIALSNPLGPRFDLSAIRARLISQAARHSP